LAGTAAGERRLTGIIKLDDRFLATSSADRLSSRDPIPDGRISEERTFGFAGRQPAAFAVKASYSFRCSPHRSIRPHLFAPPLERIEVARIKTASQPPLFSSVIHSVDL